MNQLISKTIFLDFLLCPKNVWLKLHRPELLESFMLSEFEKHLMEQGNEVELVARNLFPEGILITANGEEAAHETSKLISSKASTIFQATFINDGFIARNDVLVFNQETQNWDLYEIKATNSVKEDSSERDHIEDLAFQAVILTKSKIPLGKCFVIHMNKEYIRRGNLNINQLFKKEDQTEKVVARMTEVEDRLKVVKEYLSSKEEPLGNCECLYKSRVNHCTTFKYSNNHVPEYSIHDLSRISKKKIEILIESGILDLHSIPNDFALSDIQQNQILVHKKDEPVINTVAIREILSDLEFPLYFLDYEDYGPAIPAFDGFSPYKKIPFQFSLHILKDKKSELQHVEFLQESLSDPSELVAQKLQKSISSIGTVIAWHKSHEASINNEIAERLPQYKMFFDSINNRLFDLKDIFSKQLYIHKNFKGKTSIKKVLPAIVQDIKKYSELDINNGAQASDSWWKMVSLPILGEEKLKIVKDLKVYCGVDTEAMYRIWKHLDEL